jgi:putative ABC transport system permease protein
MSALEMIASALSALRANKLRSFLTMLGILIGVASIIAIVSLGRGGQSAIVSTIESTRMQRTIQILPKELVEPGLPQPGQVLAFDDSDFEIARQFAGVSDVFYTLNGQAQVTTAKKAFTVSVESGPSYLDELGHFQVINGRMFSQADVIAHRPVALVSQSLAEKLFGSQSSIGQTVTMGGQPMQVIGETESTQVNFLSGFLGSDEIYLPYTTCRDIFPNWPISEMDIEVKPGVDKPALAQHIVTALNIHAHNAEAFEDSAKFYAGLEQTIGKITSILTLVIGAIAAIALIVGGVGVMNIMLVSVTERTQEIGIRISLGATRRAILLQFLTESVAITVIGGSLGILVGVITAFAIHVATGLPALISWWSIVVSVAFSAVIGLICGLYPANKASRQNPIEALRYE